jgi:hypothetical protein
MAEIVNLRRFRKQARRAQAEKQAEQNRARYGQTRHERQLRRAQEKAAEAFIEGHRRDTERS